MRNYILRRLLLLFPILFGVTIATFIIFRLVPGDPAQLICGIQCTPEQLEALRQELGLNRPWYQQYFEWLGGIFKGDLGDSVVTPLSLAEELRVRLPVTAELLIMTLIFSLVLGIPPGIISAIRPNTPIDWLARFVSVLGLSVPNFWLGTLFIILPLLWFNWIPPLGQYTPFFDNPGRNLELFVFPALALGAATAAGVMRLTRSSLLEVMRNDYIRTAWSKGLRERSIVYRHAMKNAMIPVVTVLGLQVGILLGGSVIMESVFGLPGVGLLVLEAILRRDYFIVQGIVFLAGAVFVLANLLVDVMYAWLDPRIRYA